ANIPNPNPMREACAHRLHDGLFRGEAHRDEACRPLCLGQLFALRRHQQMVDETRAESLQCSGDALHLQHIHANAENHSRAAIISCFMSRTATVRPSNSARAMMAWPMFNSTI